MSDTISNERFSNFLSEEELQTSISRTLSENSIKKANWAVGVFNSWLKARQHSGLIIGLHVFKPIEDMLPSELDSQLQYFVFEAKKTNGQR